MTAQNTAGVLAVEPVAPDSVARQLDAVLDDIGVDAVKIGMLANAEIGDARWPAASTRSAREVPVVLDPVLRASDGTPLLEPGGLERMAGELLPRVTVLTPNRVEAGALLGRAVTSEGEVEAAARELACSRPRGTRHRRRCRRRRGGGRPGRSRRTGHRVPSGEAAVTLDARHRLHPVGGPGGAARERGRAGGGGRVGDRLRAPRDGSRPRPRARAGAARPRRRRPDLIAAAAPPRPRPDRGLYF